MRTCLCVVLLLTLTACGANIGALSTRPVVEGDPQRGLQMIEQYGCPACHVIPGTRGVKAWIGPPLENWSARHYVAGSLPNTPENLIHWIRHPQSVEPGNAMPDLGVTLEDARDISAYLYTLRDD